MTEQIERLSDEEIANIRDYYGLPHVHGNICRGDYGMECDDTVVIGKLVAEIDSLRSALSEVTKERDLAIDHAQNHASVSFDECNFQPCKSAREPLPTGEKGE